jgi:hypothetical protein
LGGRGCERGVYEQIGSILLHCDAGWHANQMVLPKNPFSISSWHRKQSTPVSPFWALRCVRRRVVVSEQASSRSQCLALSAGADPAKPPAPRQRPALLDPARPAAVEVAKVEITKLVGRCAGGGHTAFPPEA